MPTNIELAQLQTLVRQGAQVVEVLPAEDYDAEHLPGAINLPLKTLDRDTAAVLRRDRPIVVYCHDFQ